jgi:hypothetical protein
VQVLLSHTLAELEPNMQAQIAVIQEKGLKSVAVNCLQHAQRCLDVQEQHFQRLLYMSDTGYFYVRHSVFPAVVGEYSAIIISYTKDRYDRRFYIMRFCC